MKSKPTVTNLRNLLVSGGVSLAVSLIVSLAVSIAILLLAGWAWAVAPGTAETTAVQTWWATTDTQEAAYYVVHGAYEQRLPVTIGTLTYMTHVYQGPLGAGYVHEVQYTDGTLTYVITALHGPEQRSTPLVWTLIPVRP